MRRRPQKRSGPESALRRAALRLTAALEAAPPHKAADLALKLSALSRALAAEQARAPETMEDPNEDARLRREFDEEIEYLIGLRAQEKADAMLAARSASGGGDGAGGPRIF